MSETPKKDAYTVKDFLHILNTLKDEGFDYTIIGGCAVGAYAHHINETVFSDDLDLYTSTTTQKEILDWARSNSIEIDNVPDPRSVPVAVLDWSGMEVNLVTDSTGLPDPTETVRLARMFHIQEPKETNVLIADPFDLLKNKLQVDREKDQKHVRILKKFIHEEIVHEFRENEIARKKISPARRFLEITNQK